MEIRNKPIYSKIWKDSEGINSCLLLQEIGFRLKYFEIKEIYGVCSEVTYMSMSGDASCNGLYSSQDGQTLVLHPGIITFFLFQITFQIFFCPIVSQDEQCSLPGWVRFGKMWQSLDMKLKLEILLDKVSLEKRQFK